MKRTTLSILALGVFSLVPFAGACGLYGTYKTDAGVLAALNASSDEDSDAAIAELRARGEEGFAAVLKAGELMNGHPRYAAIIDQVAKQKDASKSRLYWHTDFDQALSAAAKSERPILSLRLLGKLDEEFSCANSRLFREVLYADPKISNYLREHFVLHWKSVRPVPVMTIDFGDGRVLKRTITGNSAHYVLDSRGRVVDALPGLYRPEKFLEILVKAEAFAEEHGDECSRVWPASLTTYHQSKLAALQANFSTLIRRSGLSALTDRLSDPIQMGDLGADEWALIAANTHERLHSVAARANALTAGKSLMEAPLIANVAEASLAARKLANLKLATAEDSVRNEYIFHRRIHERLAAASNHTNIDELNSWVYGELFQMPESDPWLGLHTPEVFTGLKDNGIVGRD